jgi:hypothetical protein
VIDDLLRQFPARTHPLIVVRDCDGLLAEEDVLAALAKRGYCVIDEPDLVRLRQRVEGAKPFSVCARHRSSPPGSLVFRATSGRWMGYGAVEAT